MPEPAEAREHAPGNDRAAQDTHGSPTSGGPASAHGALLQLQQKAGNRAVTRLIAAQGSPNGGAVLQRAPNKANVDHEKAASAANVLVPLIKSRIQKAGMKTVPQAEADLLIGLVANFLQQYGDGNAFLIVAPLSDDLYALLAPWGYSGGGVSKGRMGQVLENLDAAIGKWRAQSEKQRGTAMKATPTTMGNYTAKPSLRDMEIEDQQVHMVEMEGGQYTGTKANIRAEKERRKNAKALAGIKGTRSAGPIGTLGMVVGAGTAALTGGDTAFGRDSGLAIGGLGDTIFETARDAANARQASLPDAPPATPTMVERRRREPMPTPDRPSSGDGAGPAPGQTLPGMGAAGPAGAGAGPATLHGMGAAGPGSGATPPTTQAGYAPGPGGTLHGMGGAGPGGAAKPPGTQAGYAPGPGGSPAPKPSTPDDIAHADTGVPAAGGPSAAAAQGGPNRYGMEGYWARLEIPDYPSPAPPRANVNPTTPQQVKVAFQQRQDRVIVSSDSKFHKFRWELLRWAEGRPTQEPAPIAFTADDGYIHVDGNRWMAEVGNPREIMK